MKAVPAAIAKAFGQLGDRAVIAVLIKSIAVTLVLFAGLGAGLYVAFAAAAERLGQSAGWGGVFALLLLPVAVWLLFRVVAVAVLQFFADEVVAAVEARHYSVMASRAQPLTLRREIAVATRGLMRALGYNLLALPLAGLVAFTGIGPTLVFLLVNAVLLGRELTDMAWLRHCEGAEQSNPAGRGERFAMGAVIAGLMLVPFVNLLAPVVGAAAGTHLVLGRLEGRREGQ
jgi:uncharacterized protein involved in cysteine biosynthesis